MDLDLNLSSDDNNNNNEYTHQQQLIIDKYHNNINDQYDGEEFEDNDNGYNQHVRNDNLDNIDQEHDIDDNIFEDIDEWEAVDDNVNDVDEQPDLIDDTGINNDQDRQQQLTKTEYDTSLSSSDDIATTQHRSELTVQSLDHVELQCIELLNIYRSTVSYLSDIHDIDTFSKTDNDMVDYMKQFYTICGSIRYSLQYYITNQQTNKPYKSNTHINSITLLSKQKELQLLQQQLDELKQEKNIT